MLGCLNPTMGQIWSNPTFGFKIECKNVIQQLGYSIFDLKLGFLECVCVCSQLQSYTNYIQKIAL